VYFSLVSLEYNIPSEHGTFVGHASKVPELGRLAVPLSRCFDHRRGRAGWRRSSLLRRYSTLSSQLQEHLHDHDHHPRQPFSARRHHTGFVSVQRSPHRPLCPFHRRLPLNLWILVRYKAPTMGWIRTLLAICIICFVERVNVILSSPATLARCSSLLTLAFTLTVNALGSAIIDASNRRCLSPSASLGLSLPWLAQFLAFDEGQRLVRAASEHRVISRRELPPLR